MKLWGTVSTTATSVRSHAKSKGTWHSDPRTGAIVNFRDGAHMGRITRISGNKIYTNEGNTSSGKTDTVEPNGGARGGKILYHREPADRLVTCGLIIRRITDPENRIKRNGFLWAW